MSAPCRLGVHIRGVLARPDQPPRVEEILPPFHDGFLVELGDLHQRVSIRIRLLDSVLERPISQPEMDSAGWQPKDGLAVAVENLETVEIGVVVHS